MITILKNILLLYLLLTLNSSYAQEIIRLRGKVLNAVREPENFSPYSSAHVRLKGKGIGTLTNSQGEFNLKIPIEYWNDTLIISYSSYDTTNLMFSSAVNQLDTAEEMILKITNPFVGKEPFNFLYDHEIEELPPGIQILKNALERVPVNHAVEYTAEVFFWNDLAELYNMGTLTYTEAVAFYNAKSNEKNQVWLLKGRQLKDTVHSLFIPEFYQNTLDKVLDIDFIKKLPDLFKLNKIKSVNVKVSTINGRDVYTIFFYDHNKHYKKPSTMYEMMIDSETFAILSISSDLRWDMGRSKIKSRSFRKNGYEVIPDVYIISTDYQYYQGKWYPAYSSFYQKSSVRTKMKLVPATPEWFYIDKDVVFYEYLTEGVYVFSKVDSVQTTGIKNEFNTQSLFVNAPLEEDIWDNYSFIKTNAESFWIVKSIFKRNNRLEGW